MSVRCPLFTHNRSNIDVRSVLLAYTVRTIRPSLTGDTAVATVMPENTRATGAASGRINHG
jgi:hypothetical protein